MLQHHHADILAAAPDAIAAAIGITPRNPHPLAADLARTPFSRLAYALGAANPRARPSDPESVVRGYGLRSTDFHQSVSSAVALVVQDAFSRHAEHRAFCSVMEVRDYRPIEAVTFDASIELPRSPEAAEMQALSNSVVLVETGGPAQLHRYAALVPLSFEAIVADSTGALSAAGASLGASAGRTEARLLFAAIESNPVLADGEATFLADENLIASALDATTLAQAMAMLRNQRTAAGSRANNSLAHLVVEPALEYGARKLIHESGLAASIAVHASPDLATGRWYATADPAAAKTLAVLRLRGSANSVNVQKSNSNIAFDGQLYRVSADLGAAVLSRVGIVRGGA